MIAVTDEQGVPELEGQDEYRWDTTYDELVVRIFKARVQGVEAGVSALMRPRFFLARHLLGLGYDPNMCYEIGALYVRPSHRHLSLATHLVEAQEQYANARSSQAICCIMDYNERSQRFFKTLAYESLGSFEGVDGLNLVFVSPRTPL